MEVMQLICSEYWKYQILFNFVNFEIALRYKYIKVNNSPESSFCRCFEQQVFFDPLLTTSFLLLKGKVLIFLY